MDVIKAMYERWARGEGLDDDSWGDVTREPTGVDYREVDAGGVPAMWIEPHGAGRDRVLLAYHGGGFVGGSLYTHRKLFAHLAKATGVRALLVHYRLAPEFTFPAQIDDAVTAYRWVTEQGVTVALTGDSCAAQLCLLATLRARDLDLPEPVGLLLMSAWVDLVADGESYTAHPDSDVFFTRDLVLGLVKQYLADGRSPTDPAANPLFADLTGLPPMYLQVGGDEAGLSDSVRLAERARAYGVDVRLDVFEGQLHTFQMAAGRTPVADEAIGRSAAWLRPKLGL